MNEARHARLERVRGRMGELGVEALLLSLGADLPWLTGYEAMPLERLTMLVVPADGQPTLVVPALEAPRVEHDPALLDLCPWPEGGDPVALVAGLVGGRRRMAVSDRTWATFLIALQAALPTRTWVPSSTVTAPLRSVKDADEVDALRRASAAADRVAEALVGGDVELVGRTEAEVSAELGTRLIAEGHQRVNFAIVGSGPNSASPHHEAGSRRIEAGEAVVCDFGGTLDGYCSDITRTVFTATEAETEAEAVPAEFCHLYAVLQAAQEAGVAAAVAGVPCQDVDAAARAVIVEGGYGRYFIHRTGHGIGLEEHEDPYLAAGNPETLRPGHAFSVEPGIYVPGRWGARIEDIVVATSSGPERLNQVDRRLAVVG